MRQWKPVLLSGLILLCLACACSGDSTNVPPDDDVVPAAAGGRFVTHVDSEDIGRIAVQVILPDSARYDDGAPVVVEISTWFVTFSGFHNVNETQKLGAISVSYLWPGRGDPETGAVSDGVFDHGGEESLVLMRDVINFASGLKADINGHYIGDLSAVTPLATNVGLWASSHSGVVATNVLAYHGTEMPSVRYLVGRENPTLPTMYPLEIGHFDDDRNKVINPFYDPAGYTPTTIDVDYSSVGWYKENPSDRGRPYFAAKEGKQAHYLHPTICPEMWGKRYYSFEIAQALLINDAFAVDGWPVDLATPNEAQAWFFRTPVLNFPAIGAGMPNLKVMLVFADEDHVQPAADKPHIHQAYNGFRDTAALTWVRLNPDRVYVAQVQPGLPAGCPDFDANSQPADWALSEDWGFPVHQIFRQEVWLASVAEMMDRTQADDWSLNLDDVLFSWPPTPAIPRVIDKPRDIGEGGEV